MKAQTFATFAECADHLQLRGYTHLSWEGKDTRLDDHHERTSSGSTWRWRYRDGGAFVWAISGEGRKHPFGRPVRLEAPTDGEYTTILACVRRLRVAGYTHAVGVDDAGVETGRPRPLSGLASIKESDPCRYRVDGADVRCRDTPTRVMARGVRITSAWEWLVHDGWMDSLGPTPRWQDSPFGFLASNGYTVHDYCACCGVVLTGPGVAGLSAVFDNDLLVVHVLEQACVDTLPPPGRFPSAAELSTMPRPVPPVLSPTSWDRVLSA